MLKKILLTSAIALTTSGMAIANPAPYVGASLGVTVNTSNLKIVNTTVNPNLAGGNYRGIPFNLFAGYGGVISQNFYLAGEVFGTVGTVDLSDNNRMKTSYGVGAAVLPGVMLCDQTLLYTRLGVVRSHFSNLNQTKTGGQFGLGMQANLTQNIDIRGEYDFVAYQSTKSKTTPNTTFSPRSDQFTVGLVYKFD